MKLNFRIPAANLLLSTIVIFVSVAGSARTVLSQDPVTGAIEGSVYDRMTESPVPDVLVTLINKESGGRFVLRTKANGSFRQGLLPPGEYTIDLSAPNYETRRLELTNYATKTNTLVTRVGVILLTPLNKSLQTNAVSSENEILSKLDFGSYHALVVGNDNYLKLPKLKNAINDAKAVNAILKEKYGFQTKLLLDAKGHEIISAINDFKRRLTENDNLLIFYSGHGVKDVGEAYWIPVDATDAEDNTTWVSSTIHVIKNLKNTRAKHILVIADSCFSGAIDLRELRIADTGPTTERERYLRTLVNSKSRVLIASGGDEPVSDVGGGNHSIFTKALLDGLTKTDRLVFTAAELFREFIEQPVSGNAQQTPELKSLRDSGHEKGYFIFVRKR